MLFLETFNYDDAADLEGEPVTGYPTRYWDATTFGQDNGKPARIIDGNLRSYPAATSSNTYGSSGSTFASTPGDTTMLGLNYSTFIGFTFERTTATTSTGLVSFRFWDPNGHSSGIDVRALGTGVNNGRISPDPSDTPSQSNYDTTITASVPHAVWLSRTDQDYSVYLDGALIGSGTYTDPDPAEDSHVKITLAENVNSVTKCHFVGIDSNAWADVPRAIYDGRTPTGPDDTFNLWTFSAQNAEALTVYIQQGPLTDPSYQLQVTTGTANSSGFKCFSAVTMPDVLSGTYYFRVVGATTDTATDSFYLVGNAADAAGAGNAILFQRTVRVAGVLTDADSTPTVQIVRLDTNSVVVATTSTGIDHPSTGQYNYQLEDTIAGVTYRATWTFIVNGATITFPSEQTASDSDTTVTTSYLRQTGSLNIIKGDTYLDADGTAIPITRATNTTWPSNLFSGGYTITFTCSPTSRTLLDEPAATGFTTSTGTVQSADGILLGDMSHSVTNGLTIPKGNGTNAYVYSVVASRSGGTIVHTLETGDLSVGEL